MHPRLEVAWQDIDRFLIPFGSTNSFGLRYELSPEHAELKAHPSQREWRDVLVTAQGASVSFVGVVPLIHVGQQGPQCNEVIEPTISICYSATRTQHSVEIHPARLINIQQQLLDIVR